LKSVIKTILAVIGGFVVAIIAISIIIALVSSDSNFDFSDKVAVIDIKGVILDPREVNTALSNYAKRDDVKAVVLRIDSPGGAVGPSQEIYREVQRFRTKKKLVVSMGSVAASGGYYIAAGADKIVANPGTITGSIGVIVEFMNTQELFKKIGLKGTVIKSGTFKDTAICRGRGPGAQHEARGRRNTCRRQDLFRGAGNEARPCRSARQP